jgi:4-carboxymuconolactone decarboxylase
MARLPTVNASDNPEAAQAFAEIKATRGYVSNALRSLGHSPVALLHFARVGQYVKYESKLSERLRELAIVCAARGIPYEWTHHVPLALQAGIPREALDDIDAQRDPSSLAAGERAIAAFVRELFTPASVAQGTFDEMRRHWSPAEISDVVFTAVYYRALATAAMALGVELEGDDVLASERDWQRQRA